MDKSRKSDNTTIKIDKKTLSDGFQTLGLSVSNHIQEKIIKDIQTPMPDLTEDSDLE